VFGHKEKAITVFVAVFREKTFNQAFWEVYFLNGKKSL